MATPGQPTLCKREYCELAHNYCRLGATNEGLGGFFGVARRTIQNWIATHPDFAKAVRGGLGDFRSDGTASGSIRAEMRARTFMVQRAHSVRLIPAERNVLLPSTTSAGESMRCVGD